jgi:type IV pilus assembly protein PilB
MDKTGLQLDLTKLGFEAQELEHFQNAIARPYGMVLVTGPTGSGKTTTLYSLLAEINKSVRNIQTAEDPVELNMHGINQVQVNEEIGLTFASSLRAFLRQDPDVIMVGEVRDYETAEIAVKAALTGHLVLSTLHTNDAPSSVTRLLDMGVEPFLVSSSVMLVAAQRLVRLVCPTCRIASEPRSVESLLELGFQKKELQGLKLYHGRGCDECADTGYRGRIALYEVLPITDEIRDLIVARAHAVDIRKKSIALGMRTLRESGLDKVRRGMTTIEEVLRVTGD